MKDFDVDRQKREVADRSFKIGGKEFVYRAAVAPEAILAWSEAASAGDESRSRLQAASMRLEAAQKAELPTKEIGEYEMKLADALEASAGAGTGEGDFIRLLDETVSAIIEPEYQDAWRAVRSPDALHPLNIEDLQGLMEYLVAEVVGRPTGPPSDSSPSGARNGESSTDESLPQAEAASTDSTTVEEAEPVVSTPVSSAT